MSLRTQFLRASTASRVEILVNLLMVPGWLIPGGASASASAASKWLAVPLCFRRCLWIGCWWHCRRCPDRFPRTVAVVLPKRASCRVDPRSGRQEEKNYKNLVSWQGSNRILPRV